MFVFVFVFTFIFLLLALNSCIYILFYVMCVMYYILQNRKVCVQEKTNLR